MIDAVNILQTISLAMAAWTVKTLLAVTIKQAEHGQKLTTHDEKFTTHHERLEKLEEKPVCPHIPRV